MIDTVVLTLDSTKFNILDHERFSPSTSGLFDTSYRLGGRANMVCKQNPTTKELEQGIYKPRLSVTKRFNKDRNYEITMKIEFSAPKLLHGNNFDELTDSDFSAIIGRLSGLLKQMGVYVFEHNLQTARVSAIHFSKNIPLIDHSTPQTYIQQLAKVNINQNLDTNQTDYRNAGHSFKLHANSWELAFYDKIKDLQQAKKSEKRAIEKDNAIQLNIFEKVSTQKPLEILRMEARLNKRQKIRQILKKLGIYADITFTNLFSLKLSRMVLLYYLAELERNYPRLLSYTYESPKTLFANLLIANPKLSLSNSLKMLGLRVLLEEVGIREFRQITKRYGNQVWYGLNREMKSLKKSDTSNIFTTLKNEITNFKPLKLSDYEATMLNKDKNG